MKPLVRVLQLASFTGNIGDNANHTGTRFQFQHQLPYRFDFTELEIREFFWGKRLWNLDLIDYINQFDLFMAGGGNFFELWVEKSATGCSIELPVNLLEKIRCPMLFYGLGVDAGQGVPQQCAERFAVFLKYLLNESRCCVCVRNDGALRTLQSYFSQLPLEKVLHAPDGGFFYPRTFPPAEANDGPLSGEKWIAVNVANDMLEQRFPSGSANGDQLDYPGFNREFAHVLERLLEAHRDHSLVLIPHIWRDIGAIFQLLEQVPDSLRRRRVSVAPYLAGYDGALRNFRLYQGADLCLATRFHANVCALAMGTPTVALANYPQIQFLYEELSLQDCLIQANLKGFGERLLALADSALRSPQIFQQMQVEVRKKIDSDMAAAMKAVNRWLHDVTG